MTCKKDHVPFNGTPEQEKALKEVIAQLKDTKGALMPIMQHAQDIYGYLPIEVQTRYEQAMHPKWNLFWQQTQNLQVSLNAQRDNSKQV